MKAATKKKNTLIRRGAYLALLTPAHPRQAVDMSRGDSRGEAGEKEEKIRTRVSRIQEDHLSGRSWKLTQVQAGVVGAFCKSGTGYSTHRLLSALLAGRQGADAMDTLFGQEANVGNEGTYTLEDCLWSRAQKLPSCSLSWNLLNVPSWEVLVKEHEDVVGVLKNMWRKIESTSKASLESGDQEGSNGADALASKGKKSAKSTMVIPKVGSKRAAVHAVGQAAKRGKKVSPEVTSGSKDGSASLMEKTYPSGIDIAGIKGYHGNNSSGTSGTLEPYQPPVLQYGTRDVSLAQDPTPAETTSDMTRRSGTLSSSTLSPAPQYVKLAEYFKLNDTAILRMKDALASMSGVSLLSALKFLVSERMPVQVLYVQGYLELVNPRSGALEELCSFLKLGLTWAVNAGELDFKPPQLQQLFTAVKLSNVSFMYLCDTKVRLEDRDRFKDLLYWKRQEATVEPYLLGESEAQNAVIRACTKMWFVPMALRRNQRFGNAERDSNKRQPKPPKNPQPPLPCTALVCASDSGARAPEEVSAKKGSSTLSSGTSQGSAVPKKPRVIAGSASTLSSEQRPLRGGRSQREGRQSAIDLEACTVGKEVRVKRVDGSVTWCEIVAHTLEGKLRVRIPDPGQGEDPHQMVSLMSLSKMSGEVIREKARITARQETTRSSAGHLPQSSGRLVPRETYPRSSEKPPRPVGLPAVMPEGLEEGIEIRVDPEKPELGRTLWTTRDFAKNEFVTWYAGEWMSSTIEAARRSVQTHHLTMSRMRAKGKAEKVGGDFNIAGYLEPRWGEGGAQFANAPSKTRHERVNVRFEVCQGHPAVRAVEFIGKGTQILVRCGAVGSASYRVMMGESRMVVRPDIDGKPATKPELMTRSFLVHPECEQPWESFSTTSMSQRGGFRVGEDMSRVADRVNAGALKRISPQARRIVEGAWKSGELAGETEEVLEPSPTSAKVNVMQLLHLAMAGAAREPESETLLELLDGVGDDAIFMKGRMDELMGQEGMISSANTAALKSLLMREKLGTGMSSARGTFMRARSNAPLEPDGRRGAMGWFEYLPELARAEVTARRPPGGPSSSMIASMEMMAVHGGTAKWTACMTEWLLAAHPTSRRWDGLEGSFATYGAGAGMWGLPHHDAIVKRGLNASYVAYAECNNGTAAYHDAIYSARSFDPIRFRWAHGAPVAQGLRRARRVLCSLCCGWVSEGAAADSPKRDEHVAHGLLVHAATVKTIVDTNDPDIMWIETSGSILKPIRRNELKALMTILREHVNYDFRIFHVDPGAHLEYPTARSRALIGGLRTDRLAWPVGVALDELIDLSAFEARLQVPTVSKVRKGPATRRGIPGKKRTIDGGLPRESTAPASSCLYKAHVPTWEVEGGMPSPEELQKWEAPTSAIHRYFMGEVSRTPVSTGGPEGGAMSSAKEERGEPQKVIYGEDSCIEESDFRSRYEKRRTGAAVIDKAARERGEASFNKMRFPIGDDEPLCTGDTWLAKVNEPGAEDFAVKKVLSRKKNAMRFGAQKFQRWVPLKVNEQKEESGGFWEWLAEP